MFVGSILKVGPPQYRSSTIFEDAEAETVRDFFGDDEFRTGNKWDDMLLQHEVLEECGKTGTLVVRWVRKVRAFLRGRFCGIEDFVCCVCL